MADFCSGSIGFSFSNGTLTITYKKKVILDMCTGDYDRLTVMRSVSHNRKWFVNHVTAFILENKAMPNPFVKAA